MRGGGLRIWDLPGLWSLVITSLRDVNDHSPKTKDPSKDPRPPLKLTTDNPRLTRNPSRFCRHPRRTVLLRRETDDDPENAARQHDLEVVLPLHVSHQKREEGPDDQPK